jgi:hypothetical protein
MKKALLLILGASLALAAHATTLTLSDFESFTPSYYGLSGSWSANTALSGPTSFTIADFGTGTPKNDGSFAVILGSTQNFSAYQFVNLAGSAFTGNATTSIAFSVEDLDGNSGLATFDLANFVSGSGTASLDGLFSMVDATHIVSWGITTENQNGASNFAFTFDQVSLSSTSAIPEPSTYAALAGGLGLVCAIVIRRRRV